MRALLRLTTQLERAVIVDEDATLVERLQEVLPTSPTVEAPYCEQTNPVEAFVVDYATS